MAVALKTCLPLWVSFCGPWFPLSCQSNSRGRPSRVLNINPDPGSAICFERPQKALKKTVSLESEGGEVSYLIPCGGKGQSMKPKLEDFRERKRKKPFFYLTIQLFNNIFLSEAFQKQRETDTYMYIHAGLFSLFITWHLKMYFSTLFLEFKKVWKPKGQVLDHEIISHYTYLHSASFPV